MRVIGFVLARSITLVSFAADAQQGKPYRVGVLVQGSPPPPGTQHYSSQPCVTRVCRWTERCRGSSVGRRSERTFSRSCQ